MGAWRPVRPAHRPAPVAEEEVISTAGAGIHHGVVAGRWAVGDPIAHGGQATVHHARDLGTGGDVAIKVFHPHVWADGAFRARFRRECASLRALRHPNVIPVLDTGESEGTGWIVMPLARGGSLADHLRGGAMEPHQAVRVLAQVASALDAAHAAGHLHRDIKPANVLLESDGHAWLADFGVARPVTGTTTVPGQMVGTAAYMAPEVISGGRPDAGADIYGFACMAFEVLTGSRPFPDDEMASVLFAHVDRPAPRARRVHGGLSRGVERALARGLSKDPSARPATATALVDDIAGGLDRPDATVAMERPADATIALDRSVMRTRRRLRPTRAAALIAAGFAVLGVSAAGLALMGGGVGDATEAAAEPPARTAQRIPVADGSVAGVPVASSRVPGLTSTDLVATAHVADGVTAYSVDAGPGHTPTQVATAVTTALGGQGLTTEGMGLDGGGAMAMAWAPADFLRLGHEWTVARVPSAEKGRQDVVLVTEGDEKRPVAFMQALSAAHPATVLAPAGG